jgi:branched-chain amino acid aminotransferase
LFEAPSPASFSIECYYLQPEITVLNENGLVTSLYADARKSADSLSKHKTSNALIYALAAQAARKSRWNDALVCNTSGKIIESSIANIIWVKEGQLYTPPLSDGCVAGVMRAYLLRELPILEQSLDAKSLAEADELMLINAIRGVTWVREHQGLSYGFSAARQIASVIAEIAP